MISFRSINFYLLIIFIVVATLSLTNTISSGLLDIGAYAFMLFGISFFYSSFNKKYRAGVFLGSALFFIGTILFAFSKFEILNFGSVFVPAALVIIGSSLLITNLIIKANHITILFSALSLLAGVWLLIYRGTATVDLYLSAVFNLLKGYWVIILFFAAVIILTANNFKRRSDV